MIIDLDPKIKFIRPQGKAMFPYCNSIYIDDEIKTLIDAGSGGNAYQEIPREEIGLILLSHSHFDHTHGLGYFPQAKIMAGTEEQYAFQDENKFYITAGFQRWEELMGSKKDEKMTMQTPLPDDVLVKPGFRQVELGGVFKDGDEIVVGSTRLLALHTPGHSVGHYGFYFPEKKILFSGDMDISPRGPWYGGYDSDFGEVVASVQKLIALQPEVLVTSHRKVFYDEIEKHLRAYVQIALDRDEKIMDFLAQPRSLQEIAEQELGFYELGRTAFNVFWSKVMILKHLEYHIRAGEVEDLGNHLYKRK
ncbi:MAG TPA: MBL fold metallo-hydrolase [Syntrophomonas sp.]|jgi:glyoxylase-like metal-dependent hydrolase (beta-lactamase superfamily II)|nr:MBL fold metallo-hydrolase [Syntrophomonas sp.]HRW12016.1 MBL fold metallo-hydrolase [Syntrophomonas sp.]